MKWLTRSLVGSGLVCLVVLLGTAAGPASAQSAVTVDDGVQYAAPNDKPLLLDIYRPAGQGPFPAIVVVHGGGWQYGSRKNLADTARYLAGNGMVAFAIDYRLATKKGRTPYPAAVEDVRASIRWVREHAAAYHVDPAEVGLLGSSAGAHLVSLVGMEGKGPLDRGDRVEAVVSWSGPQDVVELYRDAAPRAKAAAETFTDCHDGLSGCEAIFQEISPITYVDPSDPPLFFANGTDELVPLAGALEMDNALTDAGVPHVLVQVPGNLHAQHYIDRTSAILPAGQTVQEASLVWLQAWLLRGGAGALSSPRPAVAPSPSTPSASSKSGLLTVVLLGAFALAVAAFATLTILLTLRRRKRRLRREQEWKEGQARYRYRSRSGSGSGSRSRSGSSSDSRSRARPSDR